MIQGASRGIEEKSSETSRGGWSKGMRSRKNIKQKESERSSKILGIYLTLFYQLTCRPTAMEWQFLPCFFIQNK